MSEPKYQRLRDWQSRLQACLRARMSEPFAWGKQDCMLFGADCVEAETGVDPAFEVRGKYQSAGEAARLLAELGGMRELIGSHFGEPISLLLARVGDVGLVMNDERECAAVFGGACWFAPGVDGLVALPPEVATVVWRVG